VAKAVQNCEAFLSLLSFLAYWPFTEKNKPQQSTTRYILYSTLNVFFCLLAVVVVVVVRLNTSWERCHKDRGGKPPSYRKRKIRLRRKRDREREKGRERVEALISGRSVARGNLTVR
jgi:hypothetical protein